MMALNGRERLTTGPRINERTTLVSHESFVGGVLVIYLGVPPFDSC